MAVDFVDSLEPNARIWFENSPLLRGTVPRTVPSPGSHVCGLRREKTDVHAASFFKISFDLCLLPLDTNSCGGLLSCNLLSDFLFSKTAFSTVCKDPAAAAAGSFAVPRGREILSEATNGIAQNRVPQRGTAKKTLRSRKGCAGKMSKISTFLLEKMKEKANCTLTERIIRDTIKRLNGEMDLFVSIFLLNLG